MKKNAVSFFTAPPALMGGRVHSHCEHRHIALHLFSWIWQIQCTEDDEQRPISLHVSVLFWSNGAKILAVFQLVRCPFEVFRRLSSCLRKKGIMISNRSGFRTLLLAPADNFICRIISCPTTAKLTHQQFAKFEPCTSYRQSGFSLCARTVLWCDNPNHITQPADNNLNGRLMAPRSKHYKHWSRRLGFSKSNFHFSFSCYRDDLSR